MKRTFLSGNSTSKSVHNCKMIWLTWTSVPVLMILIIIGSFIPPLSYISNAVPTNAAAILPVAPLNSKHVNRDNVDKFGIQEIYPTKPGGREWFINMSSPLSDKNFSLSGGGERVSNSLANAILININSLTHISKQIFGYI